MADIILVQMTCGECGCVFGLNEQHYNSMVREKGEFVCPNGHQRRFSDETDQEKADKYRRYYHEEMEKTDKLYTQNQRLKTQVKNLRKKVS